jgi:uncharacterized membrane protein
MIETERAPSLSRSPDTMNVARASARLRATHRHEASPLQRALDHLTAIVGWPGFVVLIVLAILAWIVGNIAAARLGFSPVDPPPFDGLQSVSSTVAILVAVLILTTQRREDKLADHRAQLILELSISNDQKIAKIVGLLEESRRDNPAIADRVDDEAAAMSTPSDTQAVLDAIKDLRDDAPL